jgi:hypothetical protein
LKVLGVTFDPSHFQRMVSIAVRTSEQDQSECQIEAKTVLARACFELVRSRVLRGQRGLPAAIEPDGCSW